MYLLLLMVAKVATAALGMQRRGYDRFLTTQAVMLWLCVHWEC